MWQSQANGTDTTARSYSGEIFLEPEESRGSGSGLVVRRGRGSGESET